MFEIIMLAALSIYVFAYWIINKRLDSIIEKLTKELEERKK